MSKFIYILHRRVPGEEQHIHYLNKFQNLPSYNKSNWKTYKFQAKEIFTWQQAGNMNVDEELNMKICMPGASDKSTDLLHIVDKGNSIEVKGDLLGTRVVWFYVSNEKFILSSSQQLMLAVIGNYEQNYEAFTWMLSNGSLGPGLSWDKRIRAIEAGATLIFDKMEWEPKVNANTWNFNYNNKDHTQSANKLELLLNDIANDFSLDKMHPLLTLSGGYDSRAALYLLKKSNPQIHTATWGVPAAFQTSQTDATIARQVSSAFSTSHTEYNVQLKTDLDTALNRFLLNGEGRNDHINSFMDGLEMWQTIKDKGYQVVVRADEAFGWLPVRSELDARTSVAFAQLSDFRNIPESLVNSLPKQIMPGYLQKDNGEPIEDYRDRLYQQYRLPFVIGPLLDIPLHFVEVLNPLLHPRLISFVRTLPPHLRTNKNLYANWVDKLLPQIPYASVSSIPEAFHIAESMENRNIFINFFTDSSSKNLLGNELMTFLLSNWKANLEGSAKINSSWKRQIRNMMPVGIKKFLRNNITGYQLNISSLALRALIIYRMQEIMKVASK